MTPPLQPGDLVRVRATLLLPCGTRLPTGRVGRVKTLLPDGFLEAWFGVPECKAVYRGFVDRVEDG